MKPVRFNLLFLLLFLQGSAQAGWLSNFLSDLGIDSISTSSPESCLSILIASGRGGSVDGPRQAVEGLTRAVRNGYSLKEIESQLVSHIGKFDGMQEVSVSLYKLWVNQADEHTLERLLKATPPPGSDFAEIAGQPHTNSTWARLVFDVAAKLGEVDRVAPIFDNLTLAQRTYTLTGSYLGDYGERGAELRGQLGIPLSIENDRVALLPLMTEPEKLRHLLDAGNLSLSGYRDRATRETLLRQEHDDSRRYSNILIQTLHVLLHHRLRYALTVEDPALREMHNTHFRDHLLPVGFKKKGLPDPQFKANLLYRYANGIITIVRYLKENGLFETNRADYLKVISETNPSILKFFQKYYPPIVKALVSRIVERQGLANISFDYPLTVRELQTLPN